MRIFNLPETVKHDKFLLASHINLCIYILFNFSKKYPDFSKYFIEELTKASCGICSESLNREQIVLTNPCGHILCVTCSTQLCKVWKENGTTRKRCPICRTLMLGHLFAKPALFNCSRLNSTSLFIWVPTSVYVRQNYPQSLLECLNERNFKKAFYYTFLLNSVPTKLEESLAPGWGDYYQSRRNNLSCTICGLPIRFEMVFVARCAHFFCTICSSYTVERRTVTPLKCKECDEDLEDDITDILFMRPSAEPPALENSLEHIE